MKKITLLISIILISFSVFSQEYKGFEASRRVKGAMAIRYTAASSLPSFVMFSTDEQPAISQFKEWLVLNFKLQSSFGLKELSRETDQMGQVHIRFQQVCENVPLREAIIVVHSQQNKVLSFNGQLFVNAKPSQSVSIDEPSALNIALKFTGATTYKWQIPSEEAFIKTFEKNPAATYFPKAQLFILQDKEAGSRYAYKFDVYAHEPLSRADVYVDAVDGKIIFVNNRIRHSDSLGTANTKFSGVKNIITNYSNNQFSLQESARGDGIATLNLLTGSNYGSAVDFIDFDNNWNNINAQKDEIATDAHWGMEKTYDFFYQKFNRNSIDDLGFALISFVHYQVSYANAFWNGQYMTFGDGNSSMQPLVALDIVAHEISHGLTEFTANLDYQDESGAMNEGFSDIFGACIEKFGKGGSGTWTMGEDIGMIMRSMANPGQYGDPDTYLGNNYYIGTADNGGVHTNSGILNYWFYLLTMGGNGTNDNGVAFHVNGLGIDTAAAIAYRTLTFYLSPTSQFIDARYYAIQAATDLYGPCSQAVISTTNAWQAIGVGGAFIPGVQAGFSALVKNFCAPPATAQFINSSNNAGTFLWYFGDGGTSTQMNPTHVYANYGNYAVKLVSDGGSCGIDSVIKTEYIRVDSTLPCQTYLPISGSQTFTSCSGVLYDSGGPNNYPDNSNSVATIDVLGASSIKLTFLSFDFEQGYDYLNIYDGNSVNAPLIGSYDGTQLPNGGIIQSTTGSITIEQLTDQGLSQAGFVADWQCVLPSLPPVVLFENDTFSCSGVVNFIDKSLNGAISWLWNFGDGSTSTQQNPTHSYAQSGNYSVSLKVSNTIGNTTLVKNSALRVKFPNLPQAVSNSSCTAGSLTISANTPYGNIHWYDVAVGGSLLDTGSSFVTPSITQSTTYYAENVVNHPVVSGGKASNAGGGGYLTAEQSLIFDVYKTVVLKQVKVYADAAGSRTIKLQNSAGSVIATKTFSVTVGGNYIQLNFTIPVGSNYMLTGSNLWRNNASVNYPYLIGNYVNIKSSSAGTDPLAYYYFFYDWKIQEPECHSDRVPVYAYINSLAPVANFGILNNDPSFTFNDNTVNKGANLWEFGDGAISTVDNPQHTYLANGNYTVKLSVDNGCGTSTKNQSLIVFLVSGLDDNAKDNYKVYPIPAHEKVWINLGINNNFSKYEIYDVSGRKIKFAEFEKTTEIIELNTAYLTEGIYILKLYDNGVIHSVKLIIQ